MSGHGGRRKGAGRKRLLDHRTSLAIGAFSERRKHEHREMVHFARSKAASRLDQRWKTERDKILARLQSPTDGLTRKEAAPLLESAGQKVFGSKTVFGKNPRYLKGLTKEQLSLTWSEERIAKISLIQSVRNEVRAKFEPDLKDQFGDDFRLTDGRIEECEREYKASLAWEAQQDAES